MTATDLCQATHILKSQMNRTLNELEEKGMILRKRSATDKRHVLITFNLEHAQQYEKQHKDILKMIDSIIKELGAEDTAQAIHILNRISDIANTILS